MVSIEQLDEDRLRDLSQRTDALGVLSVYVNADPSEDPHLEAARIDLKNRFRELQRRVAEGSVGDRAREIAAALEGLWPRVEPLMSPLASGRSRILLAALESDWTVELDSAMPVAPRLVLDEGPFLHPLLELLDEGRRAGVVIVSAEDARLLEWRLGSLDVLRQLEQEYVQAPHERTGQIGGGPAGQYHTPMREQRQARDRERTERLINEAVEVAAALAEERGWERILVSGGDRWTEPTTARFPQSLRDKVFADPRNLSGLDDTALAAGVTERMHAHHKETERQLLERMRDAAGSGAGALGLSEVVAALNAGRVAHLVYDPEVRYAGSVGADGTLYADEEVGPAEPAGSPEPRLTERLIARALNTSARISPIEGGVEGPLGDAAGIAALLRW